MAATQSRNDSFFGLPGVGSSSARLMRRLFIKGIRARAGTSDSQISPESALFFEVRLEFIYTIARCSACVFASGRGGIVCIVRSAG